MNRGVEAIERIVRGLLGYAVAGPVDYLALYPGRVVAQSANKTRVDVQLDTDRIPSPSNIPLRLGIPGSTVTLNLSQTVRVLVGWEGGNPSKPYALLFDTAIGTTRIDIDATTIDLNNGTKGAARTDDAVNIGSFNILGGVGNALTGIQHIAPDGTTTNFSITGAPAPVPCAGKITGGSSSVKVG